MLYALGSVEVSAMPFLVPIFAFLAFTVLVLAATALLDSDAEVPLVRFAQQLRLRASRMGRMLARRGIDPAAYAARLSAASLRRQAVTCANCRCTDLCDRALKAHGRSTHATYSFCPNGVAIESFLHPLGRIGHGWLGE